MTSQEIKAARELLGLTPDMNEQDSISYTRLHNHFILEFYEDPPAYACTLPCCTICCRMSKLVQYQQCSQCDLYFCSLECFDSHRPKNCAFVSALVKNQLDPQDKGNYLADYSYALPPIPAPAPNNHYHKTYARVAPVYLPTIGWLHGKGLLKILTCLNTAT